MKYVGVLSTVFALVTTTTLASETTYQTTSSKRIQASGRAQVTILDPISVSMAKNMQGTAGSDKNVKHGKAEVINSDEILLQGKKNQLVTLNVKNIETTEETASNNRLINNSRMIAFDGVTGKAKIRINGGLTAKNNLNSKNNNSKLYVLQVSY